LGRQKQRAVWAQGGARAGNVTAGGCGRRRGGVIEGRVQVGPDDSAFYRQVGFTREVG
jgi:hypothetical protein